MFIGCEVDAQLELKFFQNVTIIFMKRFRNLFQKYREDKFHMEVKRNEN